MKRSKKKQLCRAKQASAQDSGTGGRTNDRDNVGIAYLSRQQAKYARLLSKKRMRYMQRLLKDHVADNAMWRNGMENAVRKIAATVEGLPNQDVGSYELLQGLVRRIEGACRRLRIEPLSDTVVGSLHKRGINALSASFCRETSLIIVHTSTLVFVQLLAKAVVPLIAAPTDGGIVFGARPREGDFRESVRRLFELVVALRDHHDAAWAPVYVPHHDWPYWSPVSNFVNAIETFIVAHEYGHLLNEYGRITPPSDFEAQDIALEYMADQFAMTTALAEDNSEIRTYMVLAPIAFMKFISVLEKGGVFPAPVDHPPSGERLEHLLEFFRAVCTGNAPQETVDAILNVANTICARIDEAWGYWQVLGPQNGD